MTDESCKGQGRDLIRQLTVKPGFHPNAIACVASVACVAFGWKPGFTCLCSSTEHMKADVDAVHKRICHLLAVIRSPSEPLSFLSIEKAALLEKQRKNQQLV